MDRLSLTLFFIFCILTLGVWNSGQEGRNQLNRRRRECYLYSCTRITNTNTQE